MKAGNIEINSYSFRQLFTIYCRLDTTKCVSMYHLNMKHMISQTFVTFCMMLNGMILKGGIT
jgi:hypothetical protein